MKKIFKRFSAITAVVLFFTLLITFCVLFEQSNLFKAHAFISIPILIFLSMQRDGFAHPTKWESVQTDWLVGHRIKNNWAVFCGIVILFCFPVGLLIRKFYHFCNTKKDGSFNKKFFFFFEREQVTL